MAAIVRIRLVDKMVFWQLVKMRQIPRNDDDVDDDTDATIFVTMKDVEKRFPISRKKDSRQGIVVLHATHVQHDKVSQ